MLWQSRASSGTSCHKVVVMAWRRMAPIGLHTWTLGPQLMELFRKCGPVGGGVSQGRSHSIPSSVCLVLVGLREGLSFCSSAMLVAVLPIMMATLWEHEPHVKIVLVMVFRYSYSKVTKTEGYLFSPMCIVRQCLILLSQAWLNLLSFAFKEPIGTEAQFSNVCSHTLKTMFSWTVVAHTLYSST